MPAGTWPAFEIKPRLAVHRVECLRHTRSQLIACRRPACMVSVLIEEVASALVAQVRKGALHTQIERLTARALRDVPGPLSFRQQASDSHSELRYSVGLFETLCYLSCHMKSIMNRSILASACKCYYTPQQ